MNILVGLYSGLYDQLAACVECEDLVACAAAVIAVAAVGRSMLTGNDFVDMFHCTAGVVVVDEAESVVDVLDFEALVVIGCA